MPIMRFLLLGALFALAGCGTSARDSEPFPLVDRDATKQAFIDVVSAYYQTRSRRGKLSEPLIDDNRIQFVFRYNKILFGKYAENVQLDLYAAQPGEASAAGKNPAAAHYLVGVWYPKQGSDEEAVDVRKKIVDGMIKRLGQPAAAK